MGGLQNINEGNDIVHEIVRGGWIAVNLPCVYDEILDMLDEQHICTNRFLIPRGQIIIVSQSEENVRIKFLA